jgi:hypothetical protein
MRVRMICGLTAVFMLGFASSAAEAFVGYRSIPAGIEPLVSPVAMCGRTCRGGGRYFPGPPSVCYERGLEYCGSSRERGPVIGVPGTGVGIELGGRRRPPDCRTITIRRDDGSVRTVRRCD